MQSLSDSHACPHVLLAQEHDLLRLGARKVLSDLGCVVWAVDNGDDALAVALAAPAPVRMLVLDTLLQGVDGLTVAHSLRARWPEVAIMFLANREIFRPRWYRGLPRACAVLENPVPPELLSSVARQLLAPTAGPAGPGPEGRTRPAAGAERPSR